ncbi:dolichol kinase [Halobium salinum]|uniref:Dolichol kinase n=1 Tax=Halobium salinum TaxID=1364940 RepID=A0ABD5PGP9_9EURY|nr:dolichol kinase [Halobium salinum]
MTEIGRRLVHVSGTGLPALYLLDLVTWRELQYLLAAGLLVAGVLEFFRLFVGLDWWVYRRLTREYERGNPAGYALYFVSLTAVAFLFDPPVAVPGMLMLTVGDPISGLLGSNDAGRGKRLGVLAAMFGVCFLLAVPFTTSQAASVPWLVGVAAAAAGAAGATLADGVKPVVATYVIDDNLSIPPAACVAIWAVLLLGG